MTSPLSNPKPVDNFQEKSRLATQLYSVTGLAPIATNIVTPLVTFVTNLYLAKRFPASARPLMVRYNMQVQEVGRQLVSGTIGLLSYFGGGELTRGILKLLGIHKDGAKEDTSNQTVRMLLGGIFMNFIGYAIIRPMLGTPLIYKFLKKESGVEVGLNQQQTYALVADVFDKNEIERQRLIDKKFAELAKYELTGTSERFPFRQIQHWVDQNLFKNGKPLLGKTAAASTVALTIWLTGLTAVVYGLNRLLNGKGAQKATYPHPADLGAWRDMTASVGQAANVHVQPALLQSPLPVLPMGNKVNRPYMPIAYSIGNVSSI